MNLNYVPMDADENQAAIPHGVEKADTKSKSFPENFLLNRHQNLQKKRSDIHPKKFNEWSQNIYVINICCPSVIRRHSLNINEVVFLLNGVFQSEGSNLTNLMNYKNL